MAIEFQCHDCDASYRVEERLAGKQARCRQCGATMNIPRASGQSSALKPGAGIDLGFRADEDDHSAWDPTKPTKPGSTIIASPAVGDEPATADAADSPVIAWNPKPHPPAFFQTAPAPALSPPPLPPSSAAAPVYAAAPTPATPTIAHRTRRYRPSGSVGLDNLTPIMLLAYLAVVIGGHVYQYVNAAPQPAGLPPLTSPGIVATSIILILLMFFAVTGPLVWLAMFGVSRIMRFELPGTAYLRACTIAATPAVIISLLAVMPRNIVLTVIVLLAVIPVALYVMKYLFDMTLPEALLGMIFAAPLFILGTFLTVLIVGAAQLAGMASNVATYSSGNNDGAVAPAGAVAPSISMLPSLSAPNFRRPPQSPADPDQQKLEDLRRETAELMNGGYIGGSREAAQARLGTLRDSARSIQSTKGGVAEYIELIGRLDDLDRRAAALPSERPDSSLAQPPDAKDRWDIADAAQQPGLGTDELAVAPGIAMHLPADALLDLKSSSSDPAGVLWRIKPGFTRMTLATRARNDPTQQRPWIIPHSIANRSADTAKLLIIESDQPQITSGTIGGIPFTRVADAPSDAHADRRISYAALIDKDKWLVIQLLCTDGEATAIASFDASVRTIRRLRAGELIGDPFMPAQVAKRLADDPDHAIPLLKQSGQAAEDALLDVLKSDNRRAKAGAIEVLRAIGTEKCLPAIREIASGSDAQLATGARELLRRLSPTEADAIALAVLDLKSHAEVLRRREALKTLATAVPDESRRKDVAQVLAEVLFAEDISVREDAATALANWATPEIVPRLLPWLHEHENIWHRRAAMTVLPATKDHRAVFPIVRWIIKDPEEVVKALSAMGPVAEDEVLKLLKERDAAVRRNAARILEQIGGQKSLIPLQRASVDPRDASAAEAARRALETVRDRTKASRSTTTRP